MSEATLWRRNKEGEPVCNACGLYFKLHNVSLPPSPPLNKIALTSLNQSTTIHGQHLKLQNAHGISIGLQFKAQKLYHTSKNDQLISASFTVV